MTLLLALLMDLIFGEPPVSAHPVVWMGRFLGRAAKLLPEPPTRAFLAGAFFWMLGAATCVALGIALQALVGRLPVPFGWLLEGLLLWPLFSLRLLFSEVASVERALSVSVHDGRERLARIVSRDVSALSETEVRESALESLSENLSDSVIAPLFWWALLGLPGALLYRFANTADASWGYRGAWEWKGKWAARADDVLNWIPARLTALLLGGFLHPLRLLDESRRTPSPNGGWPMGALALSLGVRLTKPDCYVLHSAGRESVPSDVPRALRRCALAVALSVPVLLALRMVVHGGF
jgi:adenosylcobinamide-phosphate synthase